MTSTTAPVREFTLHRRLAAAREAVFAAWTDPAQLHWFAGIAPGQSQAEVDLRAGGAWRVRLVEGGDSDSTYWTGGIYREVIAPERLVFSWGAVDGWPKLDLDRLDEVPLVEIRFDEVVGGTDMTFRLSFADGLSDEQVQQWLSLGIRSGWSATLERLPRHLSESCGAITH